MRRLILAVAAVSILGCGQWKGDGTDEALPDFAGRATGVPERFGVLSQTFADHADDDIRNNRPGDESPFKAEGGETPAPQHTIRAPHKGEHE
jgi:hypothetical protein